MAEYGSLIGFAVTAGTAVPIPGVTVSVSTVDDGTETLVSVSVTNEDGQTPEISIETPSLGASRAPDMGKGYTSCIMQFYKKGFYRVSVEDVQVFPESKSVQYAQMPPLPENTPEEDRNLDYVVTPQNL